MRILILLNETVICCLDKSGKGKKALRNDPIYVLWNFLLNFFKSPKAGICMMSGFLSSDVQKYSDLDFGKWQRKTLIKD